MKFKDFVLEEGDLLDAVKHGLKAGVKAFAKRREQQTKKQETRVAARLIDAEGKELEGLIRQIVDDGFTIQKQVRPQSLTDWLKECTITKKRSDCERSKEQISPIYSN